MLAVITTVDPLVSIGIAVLWLDEDFANSPADIVIEVAALAVMTAGIIMLAHRAPAVARQRAAETQAETHEAGSGVTARRRRPRRRRHAVESRLSSVGQHSSRTQWPRMDC